jgi:hypothetical protein
LFLALRERPIIACDGDPSPTKLKRNIEPNGETIVLSD